LKPLPLKTITVAETLMLQAEYAPASSLRFFPHGIAKPAAAEGLRHMGSPPRDGAARSNWAAP
jgi:hypothetical protein